MRKKLERLQREEAVGKCHFSILTFQFNDLKFDRNSNGGRGKQNF